MEGGGQLKIRGRYVSFIQYGSLVLVSGDERGEYSVTVYYYTREEGEGQLKIRGRYASLIPYLLLKSSLLNIITCSLSSLIS